MLYIYDLSIVLVTLNTPGPKYDRSVSCLCRCHIYLFSSSVFLFVKVKLWYDKVGHQLIVNVLQAIDLPPRPDGRPRNPYVKMYFLPDRR